MENQRDDQMADGGENGGKNGGKKGSMTNEKQLDVKVLRRTFY